jgi:DNA-binding NtrC family response regulator
MIVGEIAKTRHPPGIQPVVPPLQSRGGMVAISTTESLPMALEVEEPDLREPLQLDEASITSMSFHEAKQRIIDVWERDYLRVLMRRFAGNLSQAGAAVDIDRNHLRLLLNRHRIDKRNP